MYIFKKHLKDWLAQNKCSTSAGVQPRWIQGNLKQRQSRRLGKDYLIRNIRLGKNSIVGKLVEKRG